MHFPVKDGGATLRAAIAHAYVYGAAVAAEFCTHSPTHQRPCVPTMRICNQLFFPTGEVSMQGDVCIPAALLPTL